MFPLQPDTCYHIFNHANGFENVFREALYLGNPVYLNKNLQQLKVIKTDDNSEIRSIEMKISPFPLRRFRQATPVASMEHDFTVLIHNYRQYTFQPAFVHGSITSEDFQLILNRIEPSWIICCSSASKACSTGSKYPSLVA